MRDQFGKAVDRLGTRGQMIVGLIAILTIGIVYYLVSSAGGAASSTAFTNLDPKTAGQVQSTLAAAGIPGTLVQGGTAISVPSSKVDAARIAVANSNLPVSGGGTQDGWSLFDKSSLSETDTQQRVKWQRALSGEIARTIESIDGVRSATVNLALPKDTVFTADQAQPTASVLLDTGGQNLPDESVRGIVRLVAAAVPGLTAQHVTVTNERGEILSTASSEIAMQGADRLDAEASWNRRMTALAQAQLDALLGVGNATAVVTGTLNLDQVQQTSQTFQKPVGALNASKETEKLVQSNGGGSGTGAGATGNLQGTPGPGTATGSSSNYTHNTADSTNAVPVTQETRDVAPGDVRRMSVSISATDASLCSAFGLLGTKGCPAVPKPAKGQTAVKQVASVANLAAAKAAITAAVQKAINYVPARDAFQLTSVAGLPTVQSQLAASGLAGAAASGPLAGGPVAMVMGYLKPAAAALGVLVLLFLSRRALKRRQALLSTTDASWLPALEAPAIRIEELMPQVEGPSAAELEAIKKRQIQDRVEGIAGDRPQEVAMAIRGWLAQGE